MPDRLQVMEDREKRRIGWASLVGGLALGGLAVAAMRADFLNNHRYGAAVSDELASVMALAALGVTALPAVAALRSWDWPLRFGAAASRQIPMGNDGV